MDSGVVGGCLLEALSAKSNEAAASLGAADDDNDGIGGARIGELATAFDELADVGILNGDDCVRRSARGARRFPVSTRCADCE